MEIDSERDTLDITDLEGEDPPQINLHPGDHVGRYVILGELGRGGMGAVFKAYDPKLERQIALKIVAMHGHEEDESHTGGLRARLLREAQALAQVSHPNIVTVYDVGSYAGDVFIAMEFVAGRTLRQWLKEEKPALREIVATVMAAGRGLAEAHKANIIHRDFKPENVLVGDDGRARVLDFGLARTHVRSEASAERDPSSSGVLASHAHTEGDASQSDESVLAPKTKGGADAGASPRPVPRRPEASADGEVGIDSRHPTRAESPVSDDPDAANALRVRVTTDRGAEHSAEYASDGQSMLQTPITQVGSMLGTPAYMAPEQHLRRDTDARTDQFAFCLVLYEALYGERPFPSKDGLHALKKAVCQGRVRPPPRGSKVPRWIRSILLRGLAPQAEARYANMEELLAALGKDPAVLRRKLGLGAAMAACVAAAVLGVWQGMGRGKRMCEGAADQLTGVWEESVKQKLASAFVASGRPHAKATVERITERIDAYCGDWVRWHQSVCEATHVLGQQSEQLLDLKMNCLRQRREGLAALLAVMTEQPDGKVVDSAVDAVSRLAPLESCGDEEALKARVPLPADPTVRQRVAELESDLAKASAEHALGRYAGASGRLAKVQDEIVATHYAPIIATLRRQQSMAQMAQVDFDAGEKSLVDGMLWAERARDDQLRVGLCVEMMSLLDYRQQPDKGLVVAPFCRAGLERLGDAAAELALEYEAAFGMFQLSAAKLDEAEASALAAVELGKKRLGPDHPSLQVVDQVLASIYRAQGRLDAALRVAKQNVESSSRHFGADHPKVAVAWYNLSTAYGLVGDYPESFKSIRKAFEIRHGILGEHPQMANYYEAMAEALGKLTRYDEALAYQEKSLGLRKTSLDPNHPHMAQVLLSMATTHVALGDFDTALDELDRALAIAGKDETTPGRLLPFYMVQADALAGRGELDRAERLLENERRKPARTDRKAEEQRAGLLLRLGRIKLRQGTPALAADHCRDAMRTLEARMGKDHPVLIDALDCVGRVELATGVLDSAKMHLERALALAESKIGADSLAAAEMLVSVAELMRRQNDHTGAFARLERATRVFESQRIDPMWLVSARFALAQVAREMPLHALEADELGRKALASVPDTARGRQERKAIEIFLARRGK